MPKMTAGLDRDEHEQKVDITPEMIDAGIDILMDFELGWSRPEVYAADIYRAMAFAACRGDGSASARSR